MDNSFNWLGIIDGFNQMEINHRFYESDDLTFSIPYDKENASLLKMDRLLFRPNTKKAYIIETIEHRKEENEIWGIAYGLESLLNRRIIDHYFQLNGDVMSEVSFVFDSVFTNNDGFNGGVDRSIPFLVNANDHPIGTIPTPIDDESEGVTLYDLIMRLSREFGFGYRIDYDYEEKQYQFRMYVGHGWYGSPPQAPKVQWNSKWNHIQSEVLLNSNKEYKNVVFSATSDEVPMVEMVGTTTGWNRIETYYKDEIKYTGSNYTKVQKTLRSKGKIELAKKRKVRELNFVLNNELIHTYGVDFNVGDKVSIKSETFGIVEIKTVSEVKETIIGEQTQWEILFDEE